MTEVVTQVPPETTTTLEVVVDGSGDDISEETKPAETTKQPPSEESVGTTVAPTGEEVVASTVSATDSLEGIDDTEGTVQCNQRIQQRTYRKCNFL